jgi:AcrR family transcriptional regulator
MTGQAISIDTARNGRRKPESLARLKQAARKLFVERGYDATRPQDIARAAGLGHGTFYLHYPDKRACFLSFVEDARQELDVHLQHYRAGNQTLEQRIAASVMAARSTPGWLSAYSQIALKVAAMRCSNVWLPAR